MVEPERRTLLRSVGLARVARTSSQDLPYQIELRDSGGEATERVVARAQSSSLARAIFKAACHEFLKRCIVLSRGSRVIAKRML
jgi:phosphatidate phosphatase APP1